MMLTFYDEEGSGLFTIMQYPGSDLIPKLDVPGWVKAIPTFAPAAETAPPGCQL
jgi:hypothetical protein